jgi:hypothetical protein
MIGAGGSVDSSTSSQNVNASGKEPFTAATLASACSAGDDGVHGSTTITNGMLQTDNGDSDPANAIPDHSPAIVTLPSTPAANTTYSGHVHSASGTDTFTYVFNEQSVEQTGTITVIAAHQRFQGPAAVGDLMLGQSLCSVGTSIPAAIAPETTIDFGPTGTITTPSVSFAFSSSEAGSTFDCKLDGPDAMTAGYGPCSSPKGYAGLLNGTYVFSVRAIDASNNIDSSAATRTFTVATIATPGSMPSAAGPLGGVSPAASLDRVPPSASIALRKVQRLGPSVRLRLGCAFEACQVRVRGSVGVPRIGSSAPKRYALTPADAHIPQGGEATLAPKLSETARRAVARALRRGRRIVVKLTITIRDAAGNSTTLARDVRLKR